VEHYELVDKLSGMLMQEYDTKEEALAHLRTFRLDQFEDLVLFRVTRRLAMVAEGDDISAFVTGREVHGA